MSGWIRTLLVVACGVFAAACQDQTHEGVLDDYLTRIARVTRSEASIPAAAALPAYPAKRSLTLPVPRRTIDVFEFVELHGCDLGALVGFRNSPLGRLQSASQRLGYEAAWVATAERCGPDAAEWLTTMGAAKRERVPALFWNATFAADEMRTALGASAPAAKDDLADILRGLNDSLTGVELGSFQVGELEALLARLRQGSWLGPARQDWSRWRRYLATASTMLEGAGPRTCLNRRPTPRADRLRNVFLKLYVQQIQPELAVHLGRHEVWVTELERLSGRLEPVQPPAFAAWFGDVVSPQVQDSEWRRTREVVADHAKAWQALFSHCNIEPVSALRQD